MKATERPGTAEGGRRRRTLGATLALAMLGALWLFAGTAQACDSPDACMSEANSLHMRAAQKLQQAASQSTQANMWFALAGSQGKQYNERLQQANLFQIAANQKFAVGDTQAGQSFQAQANEANKEAPLLKAATEHSFNLGKVLRAAAEENFTEGLFLRSAGDSKVNVAIALQDAADEQITGQAADPGEDGGSGGGSGSGDFVYRRTEFCKDPSNYRGTKRVSVIAAFFMHFDAYRFCHLGGDEVTHVQAPKGNPYGTGSGVILTPTGATCWEWRSWYDYNHRVGGVMKLGGNRSGRKIHIKCAFSVSEGAEGINSSYTKFGQVILYFHSDGTYNWGNATWWTED